MARTMTGGCQCGRVRFAVPIASDDAYLCHCTMCRRATGGAFATMVGVKAADVEWQGEPDWYASSPIAVRPFCAACGTPLGFRYKEGSDKMDLLVGSFDDPSRFRPVAHFAAETLLEPWIDTHSLRRDYADSYQPLVDRWAKAGVSPPGSAA